MGIPKMAASDFEEFLEKEVDAERMPLVDSQLLNHIRVDEVPKVEIYCLHISFFLY